MTQRVDGPVHAAISRRILVGLSGAGGVLISEHGLDRVIDAIDEEAERVGEVDEIGTSDVSIWVNNISTRLRSQANNVVSSSSVTINR